MFEYLALLRAAGPQRWAYDEMAAISDMKFRFAEEEVRAASDESAIFYGKQAHLLRLPKASKSTIWQVVCKHARGALPAAWLPWLGKQKLA